MTCSMADNMSKRNGDTLTVEELSSTVGAGQATGLH
jgi:hypothetical protein